MLKQYEELAVLEQGDDGAIVSIRGAGGPSVLLGPTYLVHLQHVATQAMRELSRVQAVGQVPSLALLCAEIQALLATHREACNKYEGGASTTMTLASAMEELAELRRKLGSL